MELKKVVNLKIGDIVVLNEDIGNGHCSLPEGLEMKVVDNCVDKKRVELSCKIGNGLFDYDEVVKFFRVYEEPKKVKQTIDESEILSVTYVEVSRTTVVTLNDGTTGVAICSLEDIFDKEVGKRIAYLRAKKKQLLVQNEKNKDIVKELRVEIDKLQKQIEEREDRIYDLTEDNPIYLSIMEIDNEISKY